MKFTKVLFFSFLLSLGCGPPELTRRSEANAIRTTFNVEVKGRYSNGQLIETNVVSELHEMMVAMRLGVPVDSEEDAQLSINIEISRIDNGKSITQNYIWYLSDTTSGTILATDTFNSWYGDKLTAQSILDRIDNLDLSMYKSNRIVQRAIRAEDVSLEEPPIANTQDYAIVIGIEDYRNDIRPALYAKNDAENMRDVFENIFNIPTENIKFLANQNASKTDITGAIFEWLPKNAKNENSRVFVFYSGHGSPNVKTGEAYLLPYDANPSYLKTGGILLADIQKGLARLKSKHTYLFLDTSFSGSGPRSILAKGTRPLVPTKGLETNEIVTISATQKTQLARTHSKSKNGLFTHYLIEALTGKSDRNLDNAISLSEIEKYLNDNVSRDARSQNFEQKPMLTFPESTDINKLLIQGIGK